MKAQISLLTLCLGAIALPYSAYTQEYQDCFMLDQKGNYINLQRVCFPEGTAKKNGSTQGAQTETSGVFEVPIERRQGNIPVVKVTFNDEKTVEMMVDTGASITLLPENIAKELGIEQEATIPLDTVGEQNVSTPVGRVKSIKVGEAKAENIAVGISSSVPLGLLGQNFYGKYDVVIKEEVVEFRVRDS